MKKTTNLVVYLLLLTLLFGCINEGDVFVESFEENEKILIQTSVITSFLNEEFLANSVNTQDCIRFDYPINVTTNTGQSINIINFEGLEQIALSLSNDFHINSVRFPINATINNQTITINSVNDFKEVFNTCQIPTLKNTILFKNNSCFNFQCPITLIDEVLTE